jgi:pyrrolidone-carboxylate peptidase
MALHKYAPVDGTPLSHGCVRLDEGAAIKIWCGSRDRATSKTPTTVAVQGLARPRCDHPALHKEWRGDFSDAGRKPKDGETFDAKALHHIAETRSELRRALGVDEKELNRRVEDLRGKTHGFGTSAGDLAAVARAIPHCVPTETVEEHRLGGVALKPAAGTPRRFVATPPFDKLLAPFARDYRATKGLTGARGVVATHAKTLWATATARTHGKTADIDDRPLYWTRLAMEQMLRSSAPAWLDALDPDTHRRTLAGLIDLFEQGSRGMTSATFTDPARTKRIVISGFDPFGLDTELRAANPSGAAVLMLDGQPLLAGKTNGRIEGVIFPVRYPDFDAGTVERFFGSYLSGKHPADLLMTISMGISSDTELEEAAGRRRSTAFPENLGLSGGGSPSAPVEPAGLAPGAEFLTTTVPSALLGTMRGALGRTGALKTETEVSGLAPHKSKASTGTAASATSGSWTAVTGSGGGFLSNEIFYRTLLLVRAHKHVVPMIHLHTPRLMVTGKGAGDPAFTTARDQIVKAVRDVLVTSLPSL